MIRRTNSNYQHRERRPVPTHCLFCEQKTEPVYKNPKALRALLTEKGKIIGRTRSGVCLQHQRRLTRAIKQARYMALLPFVSLVKTTSNA
jgi:small subunit ribosomal protein S18